MLVRLPAAAPGNHSACFRVRWVSATLVTRVCDIGWLRVLAIFLSVLLSLSPSLSSIQSGQSDGHSSRVPVFVWKLSCFCVHEGSSLGGGILGLISTKVLRRTL